MMATCYCRRQWWRRPEHQPMDQPEPITNAQQMGKVAGRSTEYPWSSNFAVLFTVSRSNFWRVRGGKSMAASMRSARLHEAGQPLRIDTVEIPEPRPRDVLVRVKACGIIPNMNAIF